jgi:DNA-binding NarL/FixJ family response regulator
MNSVDNVAKIIVLSLEFRQNSRYVSPWRCYSGAGMVRLVLYSDTPVLAAGLRALLRNAAGFELASVCASLPELRQSVAGLAPHVVLMDFTSEFTPAALHEIDATLLGRNVILWVYEIPANLAMDAMALGVRGILRSTLGPELVVRCLQKVCQGELWFEKGLVDECIDTRRAGLTGRETQLIRLLSQGLKNREIAEVLSITEGTVKVYLSRLFQKLEVKDRFELALYGLRNPAAGAFRLPRGRAAQRGRKAHRSGV